MDGPPPGALDGHDVEALYDDDTNDEVLEADVCRMLDAAGLGPCSVCVRLVDDAVMAELNGTWRDKPVPTDVLSFPQQDGPVEGGLLGDVVVSLDTAARQAQEHGHDLGAEVRILVAHGLAHLLGYTHDADDDRAAMAEAEALLLAPLGLQGGLVARAGAVEPSGALR